MKFRDIDSKRPEREDMVKGMMTAATLKIDSKKLYAKKGAEPDTGKSSEDQARRSDAEDDVEKHLTNIRELGKDDERIITECNEILRKNVSERHIFDAQIKKGISLRNLDRVAESLQCFENVLLKDEKNIRALTNKASSYEELSQFSEAIYYYKKVLDVIGKDVDILNQLGMVYAHRDVAEYDTAISYLEDVLKLDKKNIRAINNLGLCYEMKKQYTIALKYFKEANEYAEKNDSYALYHMLQIYDKTDDDDAALEIANKLIKDNNANSFTYFKAGAVLSVSEKYDDAIPLLKKSLTLDVDARIFYQLGFCYARKEKFDLAIIYYEKGIEYAQANNIEPNEIVISNLGICYFNINEYQTAIKYCDEVLEIDDKYVDAFYWKLKACVELGEYVEVVKNYDEHPEFQDDVGVMVCNRNALFDLGELDKALKCSNEILKAEKSASSYVWEGWILAKLERYDEAKKRYDEAIKMEPENEEGYRYMGWAFADEYNFEEAIKYYKKAWDRSEDGEEKDRMILDHGVALRHIGKRKDVNDGREAKLKEAEEKFDSILKNTEIGGKAWYQKGLCNYHLGKYGVAEDCFLKASEIIPNNIFVWNWLGYVADENESYHEAILFFEKSLLYDKSAKNLDAYLGKADMYRQLKEWSEAIECYDEARSVDEGDGWALFYKASCMTAIKKYTDALDCYDNYIKKYYDGEHITRAHIHKAWTENRLKKYDDALGSCEDALEKITEYAGKPQQDDMDEEKIADIAFIFQEKGFALEKLENYKDAIECYKKILKDDEDDEWPLKHIIFCLEKLGRIDEQKEYRRKLAKLDDDNSGLPAS